MSPSRRKGESRGKGIASSRTNDFDRESLRCLDSSSGHPNRPVDDNFEESTDALLTSSTAVDLAAIAELGEDEELLDEFAAPPRESLWEPPA
jgi:hypothetical protein